MPPADHWPTPGKPTPGAWADTTTTMPPRLPTVTTGPPPLPLPPPFDDSPLYQYYLTIHVPPGMTDHLVILKELGPILFSWLRPYRLTTDCRYLTYRAGRRDYGHSDHDYSAVPTEPWAIIPRLLTFDLTILIWCSGFVGDSVSHSYSLPMVSANDYWKYSRPYCPYLLHEGDYSSMIDIRKEGRLTIVSVVKTYSWKWRCSVATTIDRYWWPILMPNLMTDDQWLFYCPIIRRWYCPMTIHYCGEFNDENDCSLFISIHCPLLSAKWKHSEKESHCVTLRRKTISLTWKVLRKRTIPIYSILEGRRIDVHSNLFWLFASRPSWNTMTRPPIR